MAVMRREVPNGTIRMTRDRRTRGPGMRVVWTALLATIAVALLYSVLTRALFWASVKIDDIRYGYPRSYQVDGYVGYGESNGEPTHFTALNLHGQIVVYVISGDNPLRPAVLKGPALFGDNAQYQPVTLRLATVVGTAYPDLIATVGGQQVVWADDPAHAQFCALTVAERLAVSRELGGHVS